MPGRKNQPASKIEEVKLKDGSLRIGNGPTYLFFLPDGNVRVLQVGHGAFGEYKGLLKNLGAFVEPGVLDKEVDNLRQLRADSGLLALQTAFRPILKFLDCPDDREANAILREVNSKLEAARRLRNDSTYSRNDRFRDFVSRMARKLGRPPLRGEILDSLSKLDEGHSLYANEPYQVTRLCEESGLGWIQAAPPGRGKKIARPTS